MNQSLVSVGYELHETRGKTRTARRCVDLDSTTVTVLRAWQSRRAAEDPNFNRSDREAYVFARADGAPTHPQLLSDAYKNHRVEVPVEAPGPRCQPWSESSSDQG